MIALAPHLWQALYLVTICVATKDGVTTEHSANYIQPNEDIV